jgi:hypothetical protein
MPTLADLATTRAITDEIRRERKALQRAQTEISLYTNPQDGNGLVYRGRFNAFDVVKYEFPRRDNLSASGTIVVRANHFLAKLIATIPNDSDEKKNIVIRADRFGGVWRWTGLLHHWQVETKDGVDYMTVTFNDDLQILQFLLCPPNPALPIPTFQFPRDFLCYAPACWGAGFVAHVNVCRQEMNAFTLPDDPWDLTQYVEAFDTRTWQVHIKVPRFAEDSSLWGVFASRMNSVDSVISDALDDAQVSAVYRRIFTGEGETVTGLINNDIANGALVIEFIDRSGFSRTDGTFLSGNAWQGFERSVLSFVSGFIEDTSQIIADNESLYPDEYWQSGWMASLAAAPGICIRDSPWNDLKSVVTYSPATATQVVVGGDNPFADSIIKLTIETIGNLVGYFLLVGFDSLGTIIADVVMPFLVGTVAAWDYHKNHGRAQDLGWVHLWDVYQSGAEQNAWSISALAAMRGGFSDTKAETSHSFVIDESTWLMPTLHCDIGDRIGSTSGALQRLGIDLMFVNQVKEMVLSGDDTGASKFVMKCGQNKAAMSRGERNARMMKKAMDKIADIGVHLIQ